MKEFAEKLKEYLQDRKGYWTDSERGELVGCPTCGDYEYFEVVDEEALWKEIDTFCATFEENK